MGAIGSVIAENASPSLSEQPGGVEDEENRPHISVADDMTRLQHGRETHPQNRMMERISVVNDELMASCGNCTIDVLLDHCPSLAGEGHYNRAYRVIATRGHGGDVKQIACILRVNRVFLPIATDDDKEELLQEIRLMVKMMRGGIGPRIYKVLVTPLTELPSDAWGDCKDVVGPKPGHLAILMEAFNGSLRDVVASYRQTHRGVVPSRVWAHISDRVSICIDRAAASGTVLLDLTLKNVLITGDFPLVKVRLTDFDPQFCVEFDKDDGHLVRCARALMHIVFANLCEQHVRMPPAWSPWVTQRVYEGKSELRIPDEWKIEADRIVRHYCPANSFEGVYKKYPRLVNGAVMPMHSSERLDPHPGRVSAGKRKREDAGEREGNSSRAKVFRFS